RSSRGWTTSRRMRRRPTMSRVASGSISAAERLTYRIYFMPVEWAGLGPELLLALDRGREEPLRVQLERELRDAIRSGRLAAGERLPSSRLMAAELGISRGLVLECYAQLQAEGFLTSRSGSATRVAADVPARSAEPPVRAAA